MNFKLRENAAALKLVAKNVTDRVYGAKGETIKFQPIPFERIGLARGNGKTPTPITPARYFPPAFGSK